MSANGLLSIAPPLSRKRAQLHHNERQDKRLPSELPQPHHIFSIMDRTVGQKATITLTAILKIQPPRNAPRECGTGKMSFGFLRPARFCETVSVSKYLERMKSQVSNAVFRTAKQKRPCTK